MTLLLRAYSEGVPHTIMLDEHGRVGVFRLDSWVSRTTNDAEKMKAEAERLGKEGEGVSLGLDVIERIYGINQKTGNGSPDEFTWVQDNFRRISGREIRAESQVDADNRATPTGKTNVPLR